MKLLAAALAALLAGARAAPAGVLYEFTPDLYLDHPGAEERPPRVVESPQFSMALSFSEEAVAAGGVSGLFGNCATGPVEAIVFAGGAVDLCRRHDPMGNIDLDLFGLDIDVTFVGDTMIGGLSLGILGGAATMGSIDGLRTPLEGDLAVLNPHLPASLDGLWGGIVVEYFSECEQGACTYTGTWKRAKPVIEPAAWLLLLLPLLWFGVSARRSPAARESASRCCRPS